MADKIIENNQVSMMGKIAAGFTFSHQVFGEGFYMTELLVKRLSDSEDRIPDVRAHAPQNGNVPAPEDFNREKYPIGKTTPGIPEWGTTGRCAL